MLSPAHNRFRCSPYRKWRRENASGWLPSVTAPEVKPESIYRRMANERKNLMGVVSFRMTMPPYMRNEFSLLHHSHDNTFDHLR